MNAYRGVKPMLFLSKIIDVFTKFVSENMRRPEKLHISEEMKIKLLYEFGREDFVNHEGKETVLLLDIVPCDDGWFLS